MSEGDNQGASLREGDPNQPQPEIQLPDEVEKELTEVLRRRQVPETQVPVIMQDLRQLFLYIKQHEPLLHAEEVERLERICPGFANRFATLLEKETDHQIAWENREQANQDKARRRGMDYGLGVAVLLIVGAVICALVGAEKVGVTLGAASAVGMVAKFIGAWRK